jgi:KUP system potassium uptake protein
MGFTTILFYLVATRVWKWSAGWIGPLCLFLVGVDIAFFISNTTQFFEGGYVTIIMATLIAFTMLTWHRGRAALGKVIRQAMLPTESFLSSLRLENPPRVRGTAVFLTSNPGGMPHSLIHYFKHTKTLHQQVVLLTVRTEHTPEVPESQRIREVTDLGEGFVWVHAAYGFMESPDIPALLRTASSHGLEVDAHRLSFFLGRESLVFTGHSGMSLPRKVFFQLLSRNAMAASAFFRLPPGQVVELGIQVEI